jgi:hypothetical protein
MKFSAKIPKDEIFKLQTEKRNKAEETHLVESTLNPEPFKLGQHFLVGELEIL